MELGAWWRPGQREEAVMELGACRHPGRREEVDVELLWRKSISTHLSENPTEFKEGSS